MLTIFALPKAFRGHFGVIQRNAITSWTRLRPRPEIILFGDDEGTAEIAKELNLHHVPTIERNEYGTPLLNDLFTKARDLATHDVMCYLNSDILLLGDSLRAVQQAASWRDRFLMVGRRTNLDLNQLLDFDLPDWEARLRNSALQQGIVGASYYIDYFVFHRDLATIMAPFAIGRPGWDNWFIWKTRSMRIPVLDASNVVLAIHQNHDYSHIPDGPEGAQNREEARRNRAIAAPGLTYAIDDATHIITARGIERNLFCWLGRLRVGAPWWWAPFIYTSSLRKRLGLTRHGLEAFLIRTKIRSGGVSIQ